MDHRRDIATALAQAARAISAPGPLKEALDAITAAAKASVPGFDEVGVSVVHRNGKIETMSGTGQLVWELDKLQYELEEGPCVSAVRHERVVVAEHLAEEKRWPRYAPQAAEAGLRAQMAVHLYSHEQTVGGLNFYSTVSDTVDPEALRFAELFATHAALALGHARVESELQEAITSRQLVGQAVGLTMCRYRVNEERAFAFLARASQTSNLKLRLIAQEIVDQANDQFTPKDH